MEQKQLDEIEESFYSEEFVDEDVAKVEAQATEKKTRKRSTTKKKAAKEKAVEVKEMTTEEVPKIEIIQEPTKEEEIIVIPQEEVVIEETQVDKKPKKEKKEKKAPEPAKEGGSMWRAIAGVLLIVLVISIATGGFQSASTSREGLSLEEAKTRATQFVNNNWLSAPMQATLKSAQDQGDLYKFTFTVDKDTTEYYMTKDGVYFVPRVVEIPQDNTVETTQPVTAKKEEVSAPTASATTTIKAKKWAFTPDTVTVRQGKEVTLTIVPDKSNPSFVLDGFSFSIPGIVETKKVNGETKVTFTPEKKGTFDFTCSSCESWRGMNGKLIVE